MTGKTLRLRRLLNPSDGRMVIFPLDHGVTCGPIHGLERIDRAIHLGSRAGADALVLHKGMLNTLMDIQERHPGVFMHLSASTQMGSAPHRKVLVGTVEEAIRRGADGVSVHINFGNEHEHDMLRDLGEVGSACAQWQMPLLVMAYIRGVHAPSTDVDAAIAHAARVAAELGADVIKIPAPEDSHVLEQICSSLPIPVVVAGGSKVPDARLLLQRIDGMLASGARGVAVGRNVFQCEHPGALLRGICDVVHGGLSGAEAGEKLTADSRCGV